MASFCRQCSIALFGEDFGEFKHDSATLVDVVCEGCGPTKVTNSGRCMSLDCLRKGHTSTLSNRLMSEFLELMNKGWPNTFAADKFIEDLKDAIELCKVSLTLKKALNEAGTNGSDT